MEKIAVGIDLGTTYSCIAAFVNNKVEVLSDFDGNRTIPSFVAYFGQENKNFESWKVGKIAKKNSQVEAAHRVYDAKRLIGRKFEDPVIQAELKNYPFKVVKDGDVLKIEVAGIKYTPEDISAMVLKKLKENGENKLNKPIKDVVVTIPANFNDAQRQATMRAAAKAGLNVLRLITEPSAAALAYGLDKYFRKKRTVLIYDLGGGTFDVSILKIGDGHFQTLSTSGDSHLGGEDFDNRLFNHLLTMFKKEHKVDLNVYQDDTDKKKKEKFKRKLKNECQQVKHNLSDTTQVEILIESFFTDKDYEHFVTRKDFEELNCDLFATTTKCVKDALGGAHLTHDDINEVVLVGGSTKIPKIQEMIRDSFKNSEINKTINVDEAVAVGAALEAARIANILPDNFRVTEVTPFTLGTSVRNDDYSKMIKRFSPIPTSETHSFVTTNDNQTRVRCDVYEGEKNFCKDNNWLGEFTVTDVPPLPAGQAEIDLTFAIDGNGILKVTAVDKQTGQEKSLLINYGKGRLAGVDIPI